MPFRRSIAAREAGSQAKHCTLKRADCSRFSASEALQVLKNLGGTGRFRKERSVLRKEVQPPEPSRRTNVMLPFEGTRTIIPAPPLLHSNQTPATVLPRLRAFSFA